uniref:Uncharacterized protein n=1 Tax=Bradyrhizobium amphicarpaeae TaxID=1404768 RepID=A0A2U8PUU8_9BRAD|nr:hypothetical protein CIT40_17100 [Bradyrhizobium amphicarpaeae]
MAAWRVAQRGFAPCDRQKVPLSCLFFVAIQQRRGDFDHFARAKTGNHGIVTDGRQPPISEFLIVG